MKFIVLGTTIAIVAFFLLKSSPSKTHSSAYACQPPGAVSSRYVPFESSSGPVHWGRKNISYSFADNVPDFAKTSITNSFGQWAQAVGGLLIFNQVASGGDIKIVWDDTGVIIPDPTFIGYTTLTWENSVLSSAQIILNPKGYTFHSGEPRGAIIGSPGTADIDGVGLHEIGHSLGLNHSDLDPTKLIGHDTPTMNSVIYPGAEKLHQDDIAGIQALYSGVELEPISDLKVMEDAMKLAGVQFNTASKLKVPKQLKGQSLQAIILGSTYLYFDMSGKYLGQTINNRFKAR